ncbi:MAG: transposase, partial [Gammaproteobacteria bacterium]|nr:transposase [Gammaproteobacteria bacterium]
MSYNYPKSLYLMDGCKAEMIDFLQSKQEAIVAIAKKYNVGVATATKWAKRDTNTDKSHRPHKLRTDLTELQAFLIVYLRETLLLSLDDLLAISRTYIKANLSRVALGRCLNRNNVGSLRVLMAAQEQETDKPEKAFKDYPPGFIHIDIKYLPRMPDEEKHKYLFVATDRASRWLHLAIYDDKSPASAADFVEAVVEKAPFIISKILTDNGKEFTYRYTAKGEREPTGQHIFDQVCKAFNIEHRLTKPRHPQTNGMVEWFNGRISQLLAQTQFRSSQHLRDKLEEYLMLYNHHIIQKNLGHVSPMTKLREWQTNH